MLVLELVGTHLCANQPPYSDIFIKCADEYYEHHWDDLLGEVEQNSMQLRARSASLHPCLTKTSTCTTRHGGFAIPSFFPFLESIQISSKLNEIKIWMKLLEEMNSHMTFKGSSVLFLMQVLITFGTYMIGSLELLFIDPHDMTKWETYSF